MIQTTRPQDSPKPRRRLLTAGIRAQAVLNLSDNIASLKNSGRAAEALQAEHEAIESVLDSLWDAVSAGASRADVIELLNATIDFCGTHFADEEAFMRTCDYAHLDAHVAAHRQLLATFVAARRTASGEGLVLAVMDVAELLDAFHQHVSSFDAELGTYPIASS